MCRQCSDALPDTAPGSRRKLWELNGGWHCSVIGTCLTLSDLRSLGRKLKLKTQPGFPVDYQLHGYFANAAAEAGLAAKMLNKMLDRRHAKAIAQVKALTSSDALGRAWKAALDAGDIPGPYWAILTHAHAEVALCERMFADVHMLSHLVGASNRADIRRLEEQEAEIERLRTRFARAQQCHRRRIEARDRRIGNLRAALESRPVATAPITTAATTDIAGNERLIGELDLAQARTSELERTVAAQNKCLDELQALTARLKDENASLEMALSRGRSVEPTACPFDLEGQCVLYVGGKPNTVQRLRALVEAWNGEFMHHDGGLERSLDELASAIVKADAVVFPTDCVSHSATAKVKRLCRQSMKPYVPLRSTGIASFVDGLRATREAAVTAP